MLELNIADENSIELPKALSFCDLTLEEIGALVCLLGATGDVPEGMEEASLKRFHSDSFRTQIEKLRDRKILKLRSENGQPVMKIDLDVIIDVPFKG